MGGGVGGGAANASGVVVVEEGSRGYKGGLEVVAVGKISGVHPSAACTALTSLARRRTRNLSFPDLFPPLYIHTCGIPRQSASRIGDWITAEHSTRSALDPINQSATTIERHKRLKTWLIWEERTQWRIRTLQMRTNCEHRRTEKKGSNFLNITNNYYFLNDT